MPDRTDAAGRRHRARSALSIVIPVYNGATAIGELVGALEELWIDGGHEIVLVNDGSPDNSLEVCRGLVERARVPITLVDLSRNYGEHNAVMAGLRHASGAHVITMDDDLQNPPEEVERLLAFAQASGQRGRSTPITTRSSTPRGAISAAASPTGSPVLCSTSRRGFICRASAA